MTIQTFSAHGVAHFDSVSLDLGPGLHLLYGPNETGKSTLLNVLTDLLFGGAPSVRDWYDTSSRLTATINTAGEAYVLRRKRHRASLVQVDGDDKLMAEEFVSMWLQINRDRYMQLYGFDHERLRSGGQSLLQHDGDVGMSLFETGSGISGVKRILAAYQSRLQALFSPQMRSNSTADLNRALRAYQDAKADERKERLRPAVWQAQLDSLQAAEANLASMDEGQRARDMRIRMFERILRNLPYAKERDHTISQLANLQSIVALTHFEETELDELLRERRQLEDQVEREESTLTQLKGEMEALELDEAILSVASDIETLRTEEALFRRATEECDTLLAAYERQVLQVKSGRDQVSLPVDAPLDAMGRIEGEILHEASRLVQAYDEMQREQLVLTRRKQVAETDCEEKMNEVEQGTTVRDIPFNVLREKLNRWRVERISSSRLVNEETKIEMGRQHLERKINAQSLYHGPGLELLSRPFPLSQTVSQFVEDERQLELERIDLERKYESAVRQHRQLQKDIEAITRGKGIPTSEDIQHARQRRDVGWKLICNQLQGKGQTSLDAMIYASDWETDSLEVAYEKAVLTVDDMTDMLLEEAERVAQRVQWETTKLSVEDLIRQCEVELADYQVKQDAFLSDWKDIWKSSEIEPLRPIEMQGWMNDWLVPMMREVQELDQLITDAQVLRRNVSDAEKSLSDWCATYSFSGPPNGFTFDDQVLWLEDTLARLEGEKRLYDEAVSALTRAKQVVEKINREEARLNHQLQIIETAYTACKQTFWPDSIQYVGTFIDDWNRLCDAQEACVFTERQLRDKQAVLHRFTTGVETLVSHVSGSPFAFETNNMQDVLTKFSQFVRRYTQALDISKRASEHMATYQHQSHQLEETKRRLRLVSLRIEEYQQQMGVQDVNTLLVAFEQAKEKRRLMERKEHLENAMVQAGDGYSLDVILEQLKDVDGDSVSADLELERRQFDQMAREIYEATVRLGQEREAFSRYDGLNASAAELAQRASLSAEQVQANFEEVIRIQTALAMLERALERYRDENQSDVLQSAGRFFRRLTLENYVDLDLDDDPVAPRLLAVHRSGDKRALKELSDGTVDQLYFALRLAFHEREHPEGEFHLPFLMDDVLVHFDDDRARVALEMMTELAQQRQVLYFSHHRHLIDRVMKNMNTSGLNVHELQQSITYRKG